jgi:hypothetical protein
MEAGAPKVVKKKATKRQAQQRVKRVKKAAGRASTSKVSTTKPVDRQSDEHELASESEFTEDDFREVTGVEKVSSDEDDDCSDMDLRQAVQPFKKCARTLRSRD